MPLHVWGRLESTGAGQLSVTQFLHVQTGELEWGSCERMTVVPSLGTRGASDTVLEASCGSLIQCDTCLLGGPTSFHFTVGETEAQRVDSLEVTQQATGLVFRLSRVSTPPPSCCSSLLLPTASFGPPSPPPFPSAWSIFHRKV